MRQHETRIVDHVDRTKEKKTLADYGVKWEAEFPLASSGINWHIQNVIIFTTCENHVKTAKCRNAAMFEEWYGAPHQGKWARTLWRPWCPPTLRKGKFQLEGINYPHHTVSQGHPAFPMRLSTLKHWHIQNVIWFKSDQGFQKYRHQCPAALIAFGQDTNPYSLSANGGLEDVSQAGEFDSIN